MNHKILLEVLNKYYGIQGAALQIEDKFLEAKTIDFSVPQGSILSPILFTCYASTLQELFTSHISLSGYADDHLFIKSFSPIDHKMLTDLELDIKHVSDWTHQDHLKMNNGKTEFITFETRSCLQKQYLSEIRVGNDVVKGSETIRFLGIILDKDLDMKKCIAAKARTAYFNIQKIKKIRKYLTGR